MSVWRVPAEQCRGRGNPDEGGAGHGSETVWLLCQDKVTRRKGATDISNTPNNGYKRNPATPAPTIAAFGSSYGIAQPAQDTP
jgi:hypothetical protein